MFALLAAQNHRERQVPVVAQKGRKSKALAFVWRAAARAMSTRNIPMSKGGMFLTGLKI